MLKKWLIRFVVLAVGAGGAPFATPYEAQTESGIAGVARDSTGLALPGVSVEASSPALIEKARSVATDGQGLYNITGLRPGVYTVTFTLPGFTTVRREGVELTSSFTATVNAEMRVGGIEEAVTVSGASPTVDLQNTVQQKAFTREVIDALPTGSKSWASLAVLVPGARADRRAERRRHRLVERDGAAFTAASARKPSCCSTACATTRATVSAASATPTTRTTAAWRR